MVMHMSSLGIWETQLGSIVRTRLKRNPLLFKNTVVQPFSTAGLFPKQSDLHARNEAQVSRTLVLASFLGFSLSFATRQVTSSHKKGRSCMFPCFEKTLFGNNIGTF